MSETYEPKLGDVVRLKSGGPKMTVMTVGKAPNPAKESGTVCVAACAWFGVHDDKELRQGTFAAEALEKASE